MPRVPRGFYAASTRFRLNFYKPWSHGIIIGIISIEFTIEPLGVEVVFKFRAASSGYVTSVLCSFRLGALRFDVSDRLDDALAIISRPPPKSAWEGNICKLYDFRLAFPSLVEQASHCDLGPRVYSYIDGLVMLILWKNSENRAAKSTNILVWIFKCNKAKVAFENFKSIHFVILLNYNLFF